MAENITLHKGNKLDQYESILPQIKALIEGEPDLIANLSNIVAALKEQFNWLWVGFYIVKEEELVLGPFQGPVACTRIRKGRGVCGSSWERSETIIVADVEKFPGHIACSSLSRSEIVVPVISHQKVIAIMDVDSDQYDNFDSLDQQYLEQLALLVASIWYE